MSVALTPGHDRASGQHLAKVGQYPAVVRGTNLEKEVGNRGRYVALVGVQAARIGFNGITPTVSDVRPPRSPTRKTSADVPVKVVPVAWGDRGDFAVMVNIGPRTDTKQFQPTASVTKVIRVSR
jgi:hypothetical protein